MSTIQVLKRQVDRGYIFWFKDKFSFVSKEDTSCTIKPLSFTPTLSFEEWKKSIALYTPQRKEMSQLKNEILSLGLNESK